MASKRPFSNDARLKSGTAVAVLFVIRFPFETGPPSDSIWEVVYVVVVPDTHSQRLPVAALHQNTHV